MKKGITISTLTIAVTVMLILVSVSTVIGINSIRTASYEEYLSKLTRVANDVNFYLKKHTTLPIKNEIVSKEGLPVELRNLITNNGDKNNELYVVDMEKIKTETVNIGYGTVEDMDLFVVAKNTNNIYYLKGYKYKGEIYYGKAGTTTLGTLVASAADYGKTVDYSVTVNGEVLDSWKVLYKQNVDGEEYVYLIASERISFNALPQSILATNPVTSESSILLDNKTKYLGNIYWQTTPAGTNVPNPDLWMAEWNNGNYTGKANLKSISYFLNEAYWEEYTSDEYKNANGEPYVVGAIGTPTAEMFVASWNAKREATGKTDVYNKKIALKVDTYGYYINDITNTSDPTDTYTQTIKTTDNLYVWSTEKGTTTWLASPSRAAATCIIFVDYTGSLYAGGYKDGSMGLRPVICLKASIPARLGTTTDYSLIKLAN